MKFCPECGAVIADKDICDCGYNKITGEVDQKKREEMEKQSKNSFLKFKAGRKPKHQSEDPLRSGIEAMEVVEFPCCNRTAKIKPLLKMTGCYCLFCGVKNYEVK